MNRFPVNKVFDMQQKKLVEATFKKGIISAINATAFTADVAFSENPNNVIRSVPLASHINPSLVAVGDRCRIDVFDETSIKDLVVAYIYGRNMT